MKKAFTILFFFFLAYTLYAGCSGMTCTTSNGIKTGTFPFDTNVIDTVHVTSVDSMDVYLVGSGGCSLAFEYISLDNNAIGYRVFPSGYSFTSKNIRVLGSPGRYYVKARNGSANLGVQFVIILDAVRINEIPKIPKILGSEILIYPNPAQDEITLINETEEIKSVSFYSLAGQWLGNLQVNNVKVSIPLNTFASGVYFIHVATLSDKIIIKKISIL